MQSLIRILIIACLTIAGTSQAKHMDEKTIDERTQPVGKVRIEGAPAAEETSQPESQEVAVTEEPATAEAAPAEVTATPAADSAGRSGEELYNTFCIACHSVGLANAPKLGDAAAWSKVLEIGMDDLIASAKKGKNVMPPMGTCIDCSDDELKIAIQFMSGTQ